MPRQDVEFKTHDNVTLRGWLYTPTATAGSNKLPCLVMSHGWSAVKEMDLDAFAEHFSTHLPLAVLVFDNRGFGASDVASGQPRQEIIPSVQTSDIQDAITYAQSRVDVVNPGRIGVWGSSYSGGHALYVGGIDKRVKAVISQAPMVNGYKQFNRLIRCDFAAGLNAIFEKDRLDRAAGKPPGVIPNVDANPMAQSALPTADSYTFFSSWESKSSWKNEVTVRSVEALRAYDPSHHIAHISPAPLLMVVAELDSLTPADMALDTYADAREPKQLEILPGAGHFDAYTGPWFEQNAGVQTDFLKRTLCRGVADEANGKK